MLDKKNIPCVELKMFIDLSRYFPGETRLDYALSCVLQSILGHTHPYFNPKHFELSLVLCGDNEICLLNHKHRGLNKPTDVLSFPLLDRGELEIFSHLSDLPISIGDIIISLETVKKQAEEREIDLIQRFMECYVHGILHLLGWDHIDDAEREDMEQIEDMLLWNAIDEFKAESGI